MPRLFILESAIFAKILSGIIRSKGKNSAKIEALYRKEALVRL